MIISIEGNIGSGKTTLVTNICTYTIYNTVFEPIDKYINFKNHNPLVNLYTSPHTDAGIVQSYLINESFKYFNLLFAEANLKKDQITFSERCFQSTRQFIDLYNNKKYFTPFVESFLKNQYNDLNLKSIEPDIYIYLENDVKKCYSNIQKRQRIGESNIPFSHLEHLQKILNEDYFFGKEMEPKRFYKLKINPFDTETDVFKNFLQLLDLIKSDHEL